jgi:hypothetical protein
MHRRYKGGVKELLGSANNGVHCSANQKLDVMFGLHREREQRAMSNGTNKYVVAVCVGLAVERIIAKAINTDEDVCD